MYDVYAFTLQRCNSIKVIENLSTLTNPQVAWISILTCVHNYTYMYVLSTWSSPRCWTCLVTVSPVWRGWRAYRASTISTSRRMRYYYIHVYVEYMLIAILRIYKHVHVHMHMGTPVHYVHAHTSTFSKFFLFQVVDIREVEHLKGLKLLRALNLSNNPIQVSSCQSIWMVQLPCVEIASIVHRHKTTCIQSWDITIGSMST